MTVKRLHVTSRYCEVAISGNLVHLAGQLADAGTDKTHILSVMIFLKDIDKDYAAMNAVWDAWISEGHPPARTCVESKLYAPDVLVEMTVVAVLP